MKVIIITGEDIDESVMIEATPVAIGNSVMIWSESTDIDNMTIVFSKPWDLSELTIETYKGRLPSFAPCWDVRVTGPNGLRYPRVMSYDDDVYEAILERLEVQRGDAALADLERLATMSQK